RWWRRIAARGDTRPSPPRTDWPRTSRTPSRPRGRSSCLRLRPARPGGKPARRCRGAARARRGCCCRPPPGGLPTTSAGAPRGAASCPTSALAFPGSCSRSDVDPQLHAAWPPHRRATKERALQEILVVQHVVDVELRPNHDVAEDRKSTRLNSSHQIISYAVFCLNKKKHN